MALKEQFMIKTVEGATDLVLQADSGESFLVKDILVDNPASNYATVKVDKTTVGYFRVGGVLGNHLAVPPADTYKKSLLGYLFEKGIWRGIPVPEGCKLTISGVAQSGAKQVVIYEVYDGGDIKPEMPNGPKCEEYDFINYGRPSSAPADGDNLYAASQNPVEYPAFPFGDDVPAKKVIDIFGILGSDFGKTSGNAADKQITKYLKWVRERTTLFDDDGNGIVMTGVAPSSDGSNVGQGVSLVGNYSDVDYRLPFLFKTPLSFVAGEELNIYVTTSVEAGSANFTADEVEIGLIMRVRLA